MLAARFRWARSSRVIRKVNNVVLAASALVALVAFWHRNDLPSGLAFRSELKDEPRQAATEKPPFSVVYADVSYQIEPQFDYDLYGLVVSYRLHDGTSTMHRRANDHLNVADLCVVWSDTAFSPTLRKIKFWNGIFTCNFETRDSEAWARFATNQVSNNHLLSADALVRNRVDGVSIGDQIHVRGLLASYTSPGGKRGTSTTRDDQGNGACETIFIEDFAVLEPAQHGWRLALYAALATFVACIVVHLRLPYRPYAAD